MANATLPLVGKSGKKVGTVKVAAAFTRPLNAALVHQAVLRQLANRRAGTAKTKKRDEVAGGGRKPWRQKGTGRARHGSIRSPIWRKGGVVFGPQPRSFAIAMNRKARRAALAMAIGTKVNDGAVSVIDPAALELAKTKDFLAFAWPGGDAAKDDVLVVVRSVQDGEGARALVRTGRNAKRATVIDCGALDPHAILAHDRLLITRSAYEALAEVCSD